MINHKFVSRLYTVSIILLITTLFYLPIFLKPEIILNRGNDLEEFFWPQISYIKNSIAHYHQIPLWNNLILSGTPLLPDPQALLFYLLNIIFLFSPISFGFISLLFLHTLLGGIGTYLCSRVGFKFSRLSSLFTTLAFILTPKLAGFLEAGHLGLFFSFVWIPYALLSIIKLLKVPNIYWSILLSISLSSVFFNHPISFLIDLSILIPFFGFFLLTKKDSGINKKKALFFLFLSMLLTLGIISISFFPQLEWSKYTTRSLLLEKPDTYPKWDSMGEFLTDVLIPFWRGFDNLWQIDSEKWLTLGIFNSALAFYGFLKLRKSYQISIIVVFLLTVLISLNNISPIYRLLLKQNWFLLMRVSTRVWVVVVVFVIFLAGLGIEKLIQKKWGKNLAFILITLSLVEVTFISWSRLLKPIRSSISAPDQVYQFIKNDHSIFRVFCPNRCLSQKDTVKNNIETVEGYNTLIQINYYKQSWQLTNSYWDYYSLSIPPIGLYTFKKIQPDPKSLGDFNTKYIISTYSLNDTNFKLSQRIGNFLIYRNSLWKSRSYFWTDDQKIGEDAKIIKYTPNLIRIDTSNSNKTTKVVLASVYSPGWKAYLNGKEEVEVLEKPDTLMLANIKLDTSFVDFKYQPSSFKKGWIISSTTLLIIIFLLIRPKLWKN